MAAEQQQQPGGKNPRTYPVWVGSLKENVTEADLDESFRHCGAVATCIVMKDERGKSR